MDNPLSASEQLLALGLATEAENKDALVKDTIAQHFHGDQGKKFLSSLSAVTAMANTKEARDGAANTQVTQIAVREKWMEHCLARAVDENKCRQLVHVRVGSSTLVRRLAFKTEEVVTAWEVDEAAVLKFRSEVLEAHPVASSANVMRVRHKSLCLSIDQAVTELASALKDSGFDASQKSVFILPASLMTLSTENFNKLLAQVSSMAATGSLVLAQPLTGYGNPVMAGLTEVFAKAGAPINLDVNKPEEFFAQHGFDAEVRELGQVHEVDWGRVSKMQKNFAFGQLGRFSPAGMPHSFLVAATRSSLPVADLLAAVPAKHDVYRKEHAAVLAGLRAEMDAEIAAVKSDLNHQLGHTAMYIAACRAVESRRPPVPDDADDTKDDTNECRKFYDPYAEKFAGDYGFMFLREMTKVMAPGMDPKLGEKVVAGYVTVRTKFLDNEVLSAVADGAKQVVILAVGGDSRSKRLPLGDDVSVYEVDLPPVMEYREKVFNQVKAAVTSRCKSTAVVADLSKPAQWTSALEKAGFDKSAKSCWVVEGLTMYLDDQSNSTLFSNIGKMTTPGSVVCGDMMAGLDTPFNKNVFDAWEKFGTRPTWGHKDPELFMAGFGFEAKAYQFGQEPKVDYGRVSQQYKVFVLKNYPRTKDKSVGRNWLWRAVRSEYEHEKLCQLANEWKAESQRRIDQMFKDMDVAQKEDSK